MAPDLAKAAELVSQRHPCRRGQDFGLCRGGGCLTKTNPVEIKRGDSPIVLGLPHTGTYVPGDIAAKLNDRGRELADTDWHIHTLYDGLLDGATTVRATFHRYVIDANRDPEGVSLYPGQNTTTLVPLTDFDGENIWNVALTEDDIAYRAATFHSALSSGTGRRA